MDSMTHEDLANAPKGTVVVDDGGSLYRHEFDGNWTFWLEDQWYADNGYFDVEEMDFPVRAATVAEMREAGVRDDA